MPPENKKYQLSSPHRSDPLIEAKVAKKGSEGVFCTIYFNVSAIEHLIGDEGGAHSSIVLKSGFKIPVSLPVRELKEKIYSKDFKRGAEIDLTKVTGQVKTFTQEKKMSDVFNEKSDIQITAILRESYGRQIKVCTFPESAIISCEEVITRKSLSGTSIEILFDSNKFQLPFNRVVAMLDMKRGEFLHHLSLAKKNKQNTLDLVKIFKNKP